MSSGKTHGKVTRTTSNLLVVAGLIVYSNYEVLLLYLGCLFGLICDPDLDIPTRSDSEGRVMKFNKVLGHLWVWLWLPYGKLIPHRSWVSHFPIVSTLIRFWYLGTFVWFVGLLFTLDPYWYWLTPMTPNMLIYFILGTMASDVGHWLFDVMGVK